MRTRHVVLALFALVVSCKEGRGPGHVTVVGAPDPSGVTVRNEYTNSDPAPDVTTDASGAYSFDGDLPGLVTAIAPSTVEGTKTWTTRYASIEAYPDFTFTAAGAVTGRVTLGGAENGNAGVRVSIGAVTVYSDESGAFTVPVVPVGAYDVTFVAVGFHETTARVVVSYRATAAVTTVDLARD